MGFSNDNIVSGFSVPKSHTIKDRRSVTVKVSPMLLSGMSVHWS